MRTVLFLAVLGLACCHKQPSRKDATVTLGTVSATVDYYARPPTSPLVPLPPQKE
jgi:hypothetical protein